MTQAAHPSSREPDRIPPTKQENSTLLLLDGHAMVYRAWFAIQQSTNITISRTGENVAGVFGFINMFRRAVETFEPTHIILTHDLQGPNFRHKLFPEYKAKRREMPEEFHLQMPYVRRLMKAFGVPVLSMEGYEADDVLGTLSALAENQGIDTLILTGDKDTEQLISPYVRVVRHIKNELQIFDTNEIARQYDGLVPGQLISMKALKGDPSDNLSGVPSIGEKGAVKLVREFASLQGIYENLNKIPEKQRVVLETYREDAFKTLEAVEIKRTLPLSLDLDASRWPQFDHSEALEIIRELEFRRMEDFLDKMAGPSIAPESSISASVPVAIETHYLTVTNDAALDNLVDRLTTASKFTFDTETAPTDPEDRRIDPMRSKLVGLSFSTGPGQAWYIPLGHAEGNQLEAQKVLGRLEPLLTDAIHTRGAHNANYDMTVLASHGITVPAMHMDTMVAAHMLGRRTIGLKELALELLGIEMTPITDLIGTGKQQTTMDKVPIDKVSPYASADADMTYRLWEILEAQLRPQEAWTLFEQVEMPLLPVLVGMQVTGIGMEAPFLKDMGEKLGKQLTSVEEEVYESVGGNKFNMNSPAQLGELLFDQLKVQQIDGVQMGRPRKTKTGKYSTDVAVLEGLRDAHPVVNLILRYRQLSKLKSTYVDALPTLVNPKTRRVHTRYNQVGTITGRVSSNDPNLQNIPIRTEEGRRIRQAFQPRGLGWQFLGVDYSQIELRVLAHLSQDPALLEAFYQDLDIHSATASEIFNVPLGSVNSDQRRLAKVLNFGVIYGLSPFGIAQQTELTIEQGAQFIARYFARYPGISRYIEETKRQAREQGYVQTFMGKRRYLYEINSGNPNHRQAAEREAINTPVQGTAAEVMKFAMISVHEHMAQAKLQARMLLQVHDELIFETPPDEMEPLKVLVQKTMPRAMELAVPLKVTIKVGNSWGELE